MRSSLALTGQLHEDRVRARAHIALVAIAIGAAVTLYIHLHRISDFVTVGLLSFSRGAHLGAVKASKAISSAFRSRNIEPAVRRPRSNGEARTCC